MEMELEEIQCPLCKEQFNDKVRTPMLLPDCGHSYCVQCIEENSTEVGFNQRRLRQTFTPNQLDDENDFNDQIDGEDNDDDDLTKDENAQSPSMLQINYKLTYVNQFFVSFMQKVQLKNSSLPLHVQKTGKQLTILNYTCLLSTDSNSYN